MRFNTVDITTWLKHGLILNNNTANVKRYKQQLIKQFPEELEELPSITNSLPFPVKQKATV
jgi:hypothetical protein